MSPCHPLLPPLLMPLRCSCGSPCAPLPVSPPLLHHLQDDGLLADGVLLWLHGACVRWAGRDDGHHQRHRLLLVRTRHLLIHQNGLGRAAYRARTLGGVGSAGCREGRMHASFCLRVRVHAMRQAQPQPAHRGSPVRAAPRPPQSRLSAQLIAAALLHARIIKHHG